MSRHNDPSEASFNHLYRRYRREAKSRGYVFRLDRTEFRALTKQNCFYCGMGPRQSHRQDKQSRAPYVYNGVDRIDNSKGYTIKNSVSCCKVCNVAKLDRPANQFVADILRAAAHLLSTRVTVKLKRT